MVEDVIFSADGKRTREVVRAPPNTLRNILLSPEDEKDLRDVQPFVLTTAELPKYEIVYLGKQNADEIPCYVFSVRPKTMEKGERYFQGQIWVDDRDLQIVKTRGRGVGTGAKDQAFPKFETYRQQVDGKYWFPVYSSADDVLHFPNGQDQRIRMVVKYQDTSSSRARATSSTVMWWRTRPQIKTARSSRSRRNRNLSGGVLRNLLVPTGPDPAFKGLC